MSRQKGWTGSDKQFFLGDGVFTCDRRDSTRKLLPSRASKYHVLHVTVNDQRMFVGSYSSMYINKVIDDVEASVRAFDCSNILQARSRSVKGTCCGVGKLCVYVILV